MISRGRSPAEQAPRAGDLAGLPAVIVVDDGSAAGAGTIEGDEAHAFTRDPAAAGRHHGREPAAADGQTAVVVDDFDHVPLRRQAQAVAVPRAVHLARHVDPVGCGRTDDERSSLRAGEFGLQRGLSEHRSQSCLLAR